MADDKPLPGTAEDPHPSRAEVEDGLRYLLHRATLSRLTEDELVASMRALVETLVSAGVLSKEQYERRRNRNLDKAVENIEAQPVARLEPTADKYTAGPLPDIDCASIIPICKARCCKFTVRLSAQDLDERLILWDYGKPYQIRKRGEGQPHADYCAHSEPGTFRCGVYGHRPKICRTYDCRKDRRIWRDFERRILADESP
jgi:hypothetical protein